MLKVAVANEITFSGVARRLGLSPRGSTHLTIKRHIKRLGLDTSHFNAREAVRRHSLGNPRGFGVPIPLNDVFRRRSTVVSSALRRIVIRNGVLPNKCAECGNRGRHRHRPLTLQIDHKNGIRNDNRKCNLRFLCPNCHSQTQTYGNTRRG